MHSKLFSVLIPLTVAGGTHFMERRNVQMIQYPPTKDKIRGEYENKIRRDSPPEKIFEVFATIQQDNQMFMTHYDLFKSLCPYNYTTKEVDKKERQEFKSQIIQQFADLDGDGQISLYEYYFFVCLLQASNEEITQFFESNGVKDGKITKDLMKKFYEHIREKSRTKLTMTNMPDPRKVSLHKQQYDENLSQLIELFFKNKEIIQLKDLLGMIEEFHKEIYLYEFNSFPQDDQKRISGEDFAKSLISFLDLHLVSKYMKKLDDKEIKGSISFEEYYLFQRFIQQNIQKLNDIIDKKGSITRKKLKNLLVKYSTQFGINPNLDQIDIFIQILDINNNKAIDSEEFRGIVTSRSFYGCGDVQPLQKPFFGLYDFAILWISKIDRIYQIIVE